MEDHVARGRSVVRWVLVVVLTAVMVDAWRLLGPDQATWAEVLSLHGWLGSMTAIGLILLARYGQRIVVAKVEGGALGRHPLHAQEARRIGDGHPRCDDVPRIPPCVRRPLKLNPTTVQEASGTSVGAVSTSAPPPKGDHQFSGPINRIGWDDERSDQGRINGDGEGQAQTELLDDATEAKIWAENTTTMMSAAAVMRRPVFCRPFATASVLSPVRSHSSWIRDSMSTS